MGIVLPTKEAHFVPKSKYYGELLTHHNCREKLKGIKLNFKVAIQSNRNIPGVYAGGGGAQGALAPPPPSHLGKKFRSEMSKREEKVPPRYVGKKEFERSAQIRQN